MGLVLLCACGSWAQDLAPLARRYRESPTAARRAELIRFAEAHAKDANGALALLALGVTEVERGEHQAGLARLRAAAPRLPQIGDYVSLYSGLAMAALGDYSGAAAAFEKAGEGAAISGRAAVGAARAYLAAGAPEKALAAVQAQAPRVPQPEGDLLAATASEASGSLVSAAFFAQRVYYGYPASTEAAAAEEMMARLREKLSAEYPPPLPAAMLDRAAKWLEAGNHARARREYETLASQLGGADRELARVRAGAARYQAGANEAALRYLEDLRLDDPAADAERLYYLVQCARRLERPDAMAAYLGELQTKHPASEWRLGALVWAGNYHLLRNETASYVPLFRACADDFPESPRADYCLWKVVWSAYIGRSAQAAAFLQEYLSRFPNGEKAAAALYFLGRLAESGGSATKAGEYYQEIPQRFPGNYYIALAEARLKRPIPPGAARLSFDSDDASKFHVARARLLASAGLTALSDGELRFAARNAPNPQVYALELARQAVQRGTPDQGVRHIKGAFPGYLSVPLEAAPQEFWRLAFPIAYRASLEKYGKAHNLPVELLAGLIRQESEFTRTAVSAANARGLMQVLPTTGRQLAAKLKVKGFSTASLFNADLNIRMGSFYLRSILNDFQGAEEAALAAYNGGKTRVDQWRTWAEYREPAEFIETIPITETRGYVQAVLRNAWVYRRIYLEKSPPAPAGKSVAK